MRSSTSAGHHACTLLVAVVATLVLSVRTSEAAPACGGLQASCTKGSKCCSGLVCAGLTKGRNKTSGVCRWPNGLNCEANNECASGHCALPEGVCCNRPCNYPCELCLGLNTGTCTVNEAAQGQNCIDDLFCTANETCDGGTCVKEDACPLTGQSSSCDECDEAADTCKSGGTACGRPNGAECDTSGQCDSGNCVDEVCCDDPCTGTCEACQSDKTDSDDGVCAPVSAGQDPDGDCDQTQCASGNCSGTSASCDFYDSTTSCNDGQDCSQDDRCDGAGNCDGGTNQGCPAGQCCEANDTCTNESCLP